MDDRASWRNYRLTEVLCLVGIAAFMLMCIFGCTRTVYIPVESVRTEYVDNSSEKVSVDTVTDTRVVYIKGDTIIDWREKERVRIREIHDTCLVIKTDSIAVPYPVERKLTAWQQMKIDHGESMIAVMVILIFTLIWLIKRRV